MEKVNFYDLTIPKLEAQIRSLGKEAYRAKQIFQWVYDKGVTDPDKMLNLAKDFREVVRSNMEFKLPPVVDHRISTDGTQKFLFDIGGGFKTVEAVLIPHEDRNTLCLSSEVGCNMACKFCFTGKQKLKRRLTAGEIVGQYLQAKDKAGDVKITNLVFMGMGEPLDNCEAVFDAIEIFKSDLGINFSRKKITVSTSGLVDQMHKVTDSGVRLAVSLNAPNDEIRNHIMPINKKWNLDKLMEACQEHAKASGDRVTFEYVMLKDVTDQLDHAREVYKRVRHVPCKINLIPFNEHPGSGFERPPRNRIFNFQRYLLDKGMHVTIRRTMGRDIFAACGQLTSVFEGHPQKQDVMTGNLG